MSPKIKLPFTFLALSALTTANPTITPTPTPEAIFCKRDTTLSTDHISVYATPIPNDEFYIGVGRASASTGSFNFWIACKESPYTVNSDGFAGCGSDDLYTACSGNTAKAVDGTDITCRRSLGFACVTNKIYEDVDVTSYTPWVLYGKSGRSTAILRTPTGSSTMVSQGWIRPRRRARRVPRKRRRRRMIRAGERNRRQRRERG